jgi:RNA polymerase sigma factor (sigma-70 family)
VACWTGTPGKLAKDQDGGWPTRTATKHRTSVACRKPVDVAVLRSEVEQATPSAVEAVYRARHRELLHVATAITGSLELGEDAVQEGLVRALARRSTFRATGTLEAWLWKVVVNAARNLAARAPRVAEAEGSEAPATGAAPDTGVVRECLARLPERQRLVLFLRYYADLDYAAIAQVLGIRRGTVSATLNQAHAALRPLLAEEVHQ